jgi:hypothetical protein
LNIKIFTFNIHEKGVRTVLKIGLNKNMNVGDKIEHRRKPDLGLGEITSIREHSVTVSFDLNNEMVLIKESLKHNGKHWYVGRYKPELPKRLSSIEVDSHKLETLANEPESVKHKPVLLTAMTSKPTQSPRNSTNKSANLDVKTNTRDETNWIKNFFDNVMMIFVFLLIGFFLIALLMDMMGGNLPCEVQYERAWEQCNDRYNGKCKYLGPDFKPSCELYYDD